MISLPSTTDKLQAFLGGAAATTNPTVMVFYHDLQLTEKPDANEYPIGFQSTVLAGTTETDVLDAPGQNVCRHIDIINVYNPDTARVVVTVCIDENGTNRILVSKTIITGQALVYNAQSGWQVI